MAIKIPPTSSGQADVAEAFNAAMRDYANVVQGQVVSANELGQDISSTWLDMASDLLSNLGQLRHDLAQDSDRAICDRLLHSFMARTESRILALMAEIQRHDMQRQMLDSVAQMVREIGKLDLNQIVTSPQAAAVPRGIIQTAADTYVTADQRIVHANALSQTAEVAGPDIELF